MAKRNTKTASNEEIIAAILSCTTIKEAAEAAGVSTRTIYDRMHSDREFRGQYAEAKAEILRAAVFSINSRLQSAVESIANIMTDQEVNPAVRLQAAQTIITNASKLTEHLQAAEDHARKEGAPPLNLDDLLNMGI